jgi:hypothetical protein
MRIRRFNEDIDEKRFPTKVNQQEFFAKRDRSMDDFSSYERKTMIDILRKKGYDFSTNPEFIEFYNSWRSLEIVKFIDEWFTIIDCDKWGQKEFYICDGFEEVESFLNSL